MMLFAITTQSRVPVSRKPLIILDSLFRGNDNIVGFMQLCKALSLSNITQALSKYA